MIALARRQKLALLPALVLALTFLFFIAPNHYRLRNTVSYATRPLWDTADGPKAVVPHYHAAGMRMDAQACALHGWSSRAGAVRVVDAVLMSSELDLLEIRMHELDGVVDAFFVVESNATFTGLPKPTHFAANRARFARFEHKIVYQFMPGYPLRPGEDAWAVELRTRTTMTALLHAHLVAGPPVLVLMADVDEIPAAHTLALLAACDFGRAIHLQLRDYIYSFEWYTGLRSWRASVQLWSSDSFYRHSHYADAALADAGWHCSFCFRTLPEYAAKMRGFSHADRIGGDARLLDPARIQETICAGKDIFGMLPEAYKWVDLFARMSLEPMTSAVGLPLYLLQNAARFKFLLPGGCLRSP
jgi:beta-1,4-mannosyl-glycoprotein beta-1,4-N-acetylglucosaminyltransferase